MTAKEILSVHFYKSYTSLFSKTMCQVAAYQRLKAIEYSLTVSRKSGCGRLREVVVYEWFPNKAVTEDIFGVWKGGRLWEVVAPGGSTVYKSPSKGR